MLTKFQSLSGTDLDNIGKKAGIKWQKSAGKNYTLVGDKKQQLIDFLKEEQNKKKLVPALRSFYRLNPYVFKEDLLHWNIDILTKIFAKLNEDQKRGLFEKLKDHYGGEYEGRKNEFLAEVAEQHASLEEVLKNLGYEV